MDLGRDVGCSTRWSASARNGTGRLGLVWASVVRRMLPRQPAQRRRDADEDGHGGDFGVNPLRQRAMSAQPRAGAVDDGALFDDLQKATFGYFLNEYNPVTGLIADKTAPGWPSSIAAVGLALSAFPVGVERELLGREETVGRVKTTLEFLWNAPQGEGPDASGYRGFSYHFLDMETGRRVWRCELSTVDTAFLIAGVLAVGAYFDRSAEPERRIRELARQIWELVDWEWALNGGRTLTHGWKPESDFLAYRWQGYDEALLLYVLALASPTHPIPAGSYAEWARTYSWKRIYGQEYFYAGPLFTHQLSHVWIDFRKIQDAPMRERGIDYFENSRRATLVHQQYAIRNPLGHALYGEHCWGLSACDGPGYTTALVDGITRRVSTTTLHAAPRSARTTALSRLGRSSLPFHSRPRSCCQRFAFSSRSSTSRTTPTASRRPSTRPTRSSRTAPTAGCRRGPSA